MLCSHAHLHNIHSQFAPMNNAYLLPVTQSRTFRVQGIYVVLLQSSQIPTLDHQRFNACDWIIIVSACPEQVIKACSYKFYLPSTVLRYKFWGGGGGGGAVIRNFAS